MKTMDQRKPIPKKNKQATVYKRLLISLVCFCMTHVGLQAQDFLGKIVLGLNAAQIDGDLMAGFNQPGFVGGAGVEYFLSDNWSLEGQILYSAKGSRSSDDEFQRFQISQQWRLNYLDVPIMLNFYPRPKLMFQGGIGVGYYLSGYFEDTQQNRIEFDEGLKTFDLLMMFGFEYQVLYRVALGVRYGYSLFPINEVPLNDGAFIRGPLITGSQTGAFNNVLSFTIKYLLNPRNNYDSSPAPKNTNGPGAQPANL